jgi:hypothetical protein
MILEGGMEDDLLWIFTLVVGLVALILVMVKG